MALLPADTGEVRNKTAKSDGDAVFVGASVDVDTAVSVTVFDGSLLACRVGVTEGVRVAVGKSLVGVGVFVFVGTEVFVGAGVSVETDESVGEIGVEEKTHPLNRAIIITNKKTPVELIFS